MPWIIFANLIFFSTHSQSISTIPGWSFSQQTDACFLSPAGTDKGKILVYDIRKPVNTNQQIIDRLNESVNAYIQKEKWSEPIRGVQKPVNNILLYGTEIVDSKSQKWFLCYMGYHIGNKQVRLARILSIKDTELFQNNATIATKHFAVLAKQEGKSGAKDAVGKETTVGYILQLKSDAPATNRPLGAISAGAVHSVIMHRGMRRAWAAVSIPFTITTCCLKTGKFIKNRRAA